MTVKHYPATSLPWKHEEIRFVGGQNHMAWTVQAGRAGCVAEIKYTGKHPRGEMGGDEQNAAYISHCANAYPEMIEALREARTTIWHMSPDHGPLARQVERIDALLRELGELA